MMQPIVCRVNPRLWLIVPVALVEAAFMLAAPFWVVSEATPERPVWPALLIVVPLTLPAGAFFAWACAWMFCELTRGTIIADENGLRWRRGFDGWRSATWDEVANFYIGKARPSSGSSGQVPIVETVRGDLELHRNYLGIAEIIELVPVRAGRAPVGAWESRGFGRDENWSQLLLLWTKSQQWSAPTMTAMVLTFVLLLGVLVLLEPRRNAASMGIWFDWFPTIAGVVAFGFAGALWVWLLLQTWRERRFAWNRRAEVLYLDARGVIWSGEGRRVEAKWDEVKTVQRLPKTDGFRRVRVETAQGDFEIWRLSNSRVWQTFRARCQSYAPDALDNLRAGETDPLDEELGAPATAEGARAFSFRTRGNRLSLACVSLALLFAPLFYPLNCYIHANDDAPFAPHWPLFWLTLILAIIICGALWLWFARARIVADGGGLEFQSPFRRARRVQWRDIQGEGHDVWGDYVLAGGHKLYWRRGFSPARSGELGALMKQRGAIVGRD